MKFDLSSLIIALIALTAFIVPITFDQLSKRKTSKILKKLTAFADKGKLQLDKSEVFQHTYALGLDTKLKKLMYLKTNGSEVKETIYDLSEVSKVRLHHSDITDKDSNFRKIGFLRLQFKDVKKQSIDIEIYKVKQNLSYNEEENTAKKMVSSINTLLS
jgi:hypothetical protein